MAKIVHTENGVAREYTLGDVPVTVGRAARHTIPTMDARASRDHFKVELLNGAWMAADTGSRNGTLLNGQPLDRPTALKPGDRLMIGAAVFQFLDGTITTPAPEPPPAAAAAPPPSEEPQRTTADAPPASFLQVTTPDGSLATYPLGSTAVVIGRTRECTIPLDDEKLSSRHAEVLETPEGILVRDLKSTNGTKIGGAAFETRIFRDRESFTAGSHTFSIAAPRFPGSAVPAAPVRLRRPGPVVLAVVLALLVLGGAAVFAPSLIRKFVSLPPPVASDSANLLGAAGSMERGQEGWEIAADANYQVAADPDQHKDGGFSLRVRGVDTREHSLFAASSAPVPAKPGEPLRLEGWVRAQALDGRAGLRIEWLRGGRLVGATPTDLLEGTFDWKKLSVVAVPPPDAEQARAACVVAGLASVTWFDALDLRATKDTPGGELWNTPWGRVAIDDAASIRLDSPEAPLLWNGVFLFEEKGYPTTPTALWVGAKDGEPQSVGTGYRVSRKVGRIGTVTLLGVHAESGDSIAWQSEFSREGAALLQATIDPAMNVLTVRADDSVTAFNGDFESPCSEIVLGNAPALVVEPPAFARRTGSVLTLRWDPRPPEVSLQLRAAASWVEKEAVTLLADATAAARASQLGKALVTFEALAARFASREEGATAAARGQELRKQAEELARRARNEVANALKFPSKAGTQKAMELIDQLERQWAGSEFADEGSRLKKELVPEAPVDPKDPKTEPDPVPPPPDKEPIENARTLLQWAEEAIAKEEWLKAEIYVKNVMDRWPGTAEEMKAGELLGRATSGAKAARERDGWIRETLTKARNLVKNRQSDKAVPLFEEALKRYPDSPLMKGVQEELDKIRR
ncbi:MAG: FHA domain-containing protein [Planctomycetia bacterium]|nr:FHA domain-containing protein [Planctomycetia bacterium]